MIRRTHAAVAVAMVMTLGACSACTVRPVGLGPLTVEVRDDATGRPLEGIRVDVAWEVVKLRGGLAGLIEPVEGTRIISRRALVSDAEGRAWAPRDVVRLPGDVLLDGLDVLVNIEPERSDWRVVAAEEVLRDRCKRHRDQCGGDLSRIDLALFLQNGFPEERAKTYRNPDPRYGGAMLFKNAEGPPRPETASPLDKYRTVSFPSGLEGELRLEVRLSKPKPPPERTRRNEVNGSGR